MTISKKLSLAITLALGMQFSVGAYCYENSDLLHFAEYLRKEDRSWFSNTPAIAKWIEKQAINQSCYCEKILPIIRNHRLSRPVQIQLLSQIMKQDQRQTAKQFVDDVCAGALCLGAMALMTWATIEEIKNPRPRIVYVEHPKPRGITLTWTTKYPSWNTY